MFGALLSGATSLFGGGGGGGPAGGASGPATNTAGDNTGGGVNFGNKNIGRGSGNTAGAFGSAGMASAVPVWVWIVGGVVLVGGLLMLVWPRSKRRK